ncbi:LysR family transcriptional regulator [Nocardioides yefusunii]|uniref:LysR family transcriptional regulator n=1 Tax=Nocardioides yefusunii TaxID=2500546 RepID=A0ABW1QV03_9ACTN|nr:LysR family transcriptional regulator [Nocardioides yefusunii]
MDPQQLRYFLAVVDSGSVHGAAGTLGVTPPSVSQGLRALERDVRTPLFRRVGRGMVLTSAGQALVTPARRVLHGLASASGTVRDGEGCLRGQVQVACQAALATGVVTQIVAAFRWRHPRVSLTVSGLDDAADAADLLGRAVCDLVITQLPLAVAGGDLSVLELGRQEYWIAFPPGTELSGPSAGREWLRWDEIDTDVIAVPPGGRQTSEMLAALSVRQQARPPAMVLTNRESRLAFTAAGVGATWLERAQAEAARRSGLVVRELRPPLGATFGVAHSPATQSPAAAAFVQVATEVAQADVA